MSQGRHAFALVIGVSLLASAPYAQPSDSQPPCEAYSQSDAVFVGVAAAPVRRWVQLPDHPPLQMKLTPIEVERAYLGVTTPVMYLTPLGTESYATPGRKYLVYGRKYHPPDIVMASPGIGAKAIEAASEDLAFLDALVPGGVGGVVAGIVQQYDVKYGTTTGVRTPLGGIPLRIFNDAYSTQTVTGFDGRFVAPGIPAGLYQVVPTLPDDLVVMVETSRFASVRDGGCATTTIDAMPNGRVRGVLRGPDGRPLSASVDLIPMDVEPDRKSGQVMGAGSVSTNHRGEFEFAGRPAGRYYLGVNLLVGPSSNGPSYPSTYYPGTTDRASATPIVVERGRAIDGLNFSIPAILSKGELEVIVDNNFAGRLKLCFEQLDTGPKGWSEWEVQPGVPHRMPVVDGRRYQVHAHLEFQGGHLESQPYVFTATTQKTIVRLRPDAPRKLHP